MAVQFDGDADLPRLGHDGTALPPYASVAEILAHPRFPLARNHYMRVIIESYRADSTLRHLMHDIPRQVLFNIILGLNARLSAEGRHTGPTVGVVRAHFLPFGIASARSFDEMLARMQIVGLIELRPTPHDRRRRLVVPTEKMIREDLVWLAEHISPLAVLFADRDDYQPAADHDRTYQNALRILSGQNLGHARDILSPADPAMTIFLRQDASKIAYMYMLDAQERADGIASLSFEAAAEHLSTSRTHVRNLLRDLQALGMVKLHGRGGHGVEIAPGLWRLVDNFLAASMSGHDMLWQAVRQQLKRAARAA